VPEAGLIDGELQAEDCRDCPIRSQGTTSKKNGRTISVTIYLEYYQRAEDLLSTPQGKRALKRRRELPELIFGFWKQFGGLVKIAPRGQPQAFKKLFQAVSGNNLRKLLKVRLWSKSKWQILPPADFVRSLFWDFKTMFSLKCRQINSQRT
jgi:hypothetical protein